MAADGFVSKGPGNKSPGVKATGIGGGTGLTFAEERETERRRAVVEAAMFDENGRMTTDAKLPDDLRKTLGLSEAAQQRALSTAAEFLEGKIPDDVAAQVRQRTSESAMSTGLGTGQAARALSARDLGLTSLEMVQAGASLAESFSNLAEKRRQFELTLDLDARKFTEEVRRTDLQEYELELKRRDMIDRRNLSAYELIANTILETHNLGFRYATAENANPESAAAFSADTRDIITNMGRSFGIRSNL